MSGLSREPCFYRAKTHHVNTPTSIDVMVDIRFGIFTLVEIKLKGVDLSFVNRDDENSQKLIDQAKYCLIILLGGKNILVEVEDDSKRKTKGIILLKSPCPLPECRVEYQGDEYVNVNRYMDYLNKGGFSPESVKNHFHKRKLTEVS